MAEFDYSMDDSVPGWSIIAYCAMVAGIILARVGEGRGNTGLVVAGLVVAGVGLLMKVLDWVISGRENRRAYRKEYQRGRADRGRWGANLSPTHHKQPRISGPIHGRKLD